MGFSQGLAYCGSWESEGKDEENSNYVHNLTTNSLHFNDVARVCGRWEVNKYVQPPTQPHKHAISIISFRFGREIIGNYVNDIIPSIMHKTQCYFAKEKMQITWIYIRGALKKTAHSFFALSTYSQLYTWFKSTSCPSQSLCILIHFLTRPYPSKEMQQIRQPIPSHYRYRIYTFEWLK